MNCSVMRTKLFSSCLLRQDLDVLVEVLAEDDDLLSRSAGILRDLRLPRRPISFFIPVDCVSCFSCDLVPWPTTHRLGTESRRAATDYAAYDRRASGSRSASPSVAYSLLTPCRPRTGSSPSSWSGLERPLHVEEQRLRRNPLGVGLNDTTRRALRLTTSDKEPRCSRDPRGSPRPSSGSSPWTQPRHRTAFGPRFLLSPGLTAHALEPRQVTLDVTIVVHHVDQL